MTTPLWTLSASDLAPRIASGDVSAREAVGASVERLAEVNGPLNAVVDELGDQAMEAAAALDDRFAADGPVGPLHGVPVTVKVNVDQTGRATTNGVPAFKGMIAPANAPVVDNLLKAGAVVIGRTNTPEFSFRTHTDNPLHGQTFNPWNRALTPGGSSGGASSAVMAGIGALAHGNDIGGSLRFPAAATGAATVKPGLSRVPAFNPSQLEERGMLAQFMSVQGIIARTVADVRLGTAACIAPDPRDPWHTPLPLEGPEIEGPIRVAFTKTAVGGPLHPAISDALDTAASALADAGYQVEDAEPPMIEEIGDAAYRTLMGEVKALMGPGVEAFASEELQSIFEAYFTLFPPYEGDELLKMMAKRSYYARAWSEFLDTYPLVLTPFLPDPTCAAGRDAEGLEGALEALGRGHWSFSMNYMNLPAGNIAAGMHEGHPLNVQIVARRWREDLALDACEAVERAVGVMADRLFERGVDLG
ncbi:MAG: amidase family protein [Pseudomonadota bacterium]